MSDKSGKDTETLHSMSKEDLQTHTNHLHVLLVEAENNVKHLESQVHQEQTSLIEKVKHAEAEEEFITIKLLKRLEELKTERAKLLFQVEQEEEYLTNTLQKHLQRVQQEKVDLENKLEIEEEFIVNKLQKQLEDLLSQKNLLKQQLGEEMSSNNENRKLKTELENLKQESNKKLTDLSSQNKSLLEELNQWKSKFDKISSEKLELEREIENEEERQFNADLYSTPPRGRSVSLKAPRSLTLKGSNTVPNMLSPRTRGSYRSNFLKKGWFDVKENDQDVSPQFLVLTEEALLGFEHENVERIPDDAILTTIPLDKVSNVVVKDGGISIQDKGGNYYHVKGPDADLWSKLISSLLPC
jgi:hypothetical protein